MVLRTGAVSTYRVLMIWAAASAVWGWPTTLKLLLRWLISTPKRRSSCLMLSSKGPQRLERRWLSAGSRLNSIVITLLKICLSIGPPVWVASGSGRVLLCSDGRLTMEYIRQHPIHLLCVFSPSLRQETWPRVGPFPLQCAPDHHVVSW